MEKSCADEQPCVLFHSSPEHGGGESDGAPSLCDLPLIHHHQSRIQMNGEAITSLQVQPVESDFDFDFDFNFCCPSIDSEMCAADEVFFRGQILPLRRSINRLSRSRSKEFRDSGGLISSRSSSISSRQSSSSGSSADKPPKPPRNPFHSHPSPSPKVHRIGGTSNANCTNKSPASWNVFRLGLIAMPPKIVFQDHRTRNSSSISNRRSRNSTGSHTSSVKKKPRTNFLSACDCLLDAVDTVPSKVVVIKRSSSNDQTVVKKRASHHRTFEWLKQLSIEEL